jgi:short-subunit dehydrogenase
VEKARAFFKKTVIITGASSGLGRSLAVELARAGANLTLFSRNEGGLRETEKLCRELGATSLVVTGDVRKPEDCKRLIELAISQYGSLDYLVASAGVSMWAKFEEVSDISIFHKVMETNYLGAVYSTYYALPHLRKSKGMIVVISSIQGKIGVPFHTGYVASKHALQGFFSSLSSELDGSGVDVLMVLPHWLRGTNLRKNAFGRDGSFIGESRRGHSKESVTLQRCCREIIESMEKRKRELVIPPKLKILPWLNLVNPKIVEFIVKGKVEEQDK